MYVSRFKRDVSADFWMNSFSSLCFVACGLSFCSRVSGWSCMFNPSVLSAWFTFGRSFSISSRSCCISCCFVFSSGSSGWFKSSSG